MAERPLFAPAPDAPGFVRVVDLSIVWHGGFAATQKHKNIAALHEAAAAQGYAPVLEVSTKSAETLGQRLSAFNLKVDAPGLGPVPLECAFQGAKVFEAGGPYRDLYMAAPWEAKRDVRLKESGALTAFEHDGLRFPLEPRTVFYDWLYLSALYPHREWLKRLCAYAGFTDVEFNPQKSINCQARSCALFVALMQSDLLGQAMASPDAFITLMSSRRTPLGEVAANKTLELNF